MNEQDMKRVVRTAALAGLLSISLGGCFEKSADELLKSAQSYAAKGELRAATIELRNAAQAAPERGDIRLELGQLLLKQRDLLAAEKEFRRALELKQPPESVVPLLAQTLNALGRHDAVIREFGATKLSNGKAEAARLAEVGQGHLRLGKVEDAQRAFSAAVAADPESAPALYGQAVLAAQRGASTEALAQIDKLIGLHPNYAPALRQRAELLIATGERESARQAVKAAIAADETDVGARLMSVEMKLQDGAVDDAAKELEALSKQARGDPRVSYVEAAIAVQKGDFDAARIAVQQVLKHWPDYARARVLAGAIELHARQFVLAEDHLRRALAVIPNHGEARRLLAMVYMGTGEPRRATEVLQPLFVEGKQVDARLMTLAAEAAMASGDVKKARALLETAALTDKSSAAPRTRLAQISLATGKREQGLSELEQAAALDPGKTQADVTLIMTHVRAKQFDKAMAAARALEKKQPKNPLSHQMLGIVNRARNDLPAARANFERALELQASYLPAAIALAYLDAADKKIDDGRKRFESVIAENDKNKNSVRNDEVLVAYADFLMRNSGSNTEVVALLQRAVKANTQSVPARLALIGYQLRIRDVKAAATTAQEAATAFPNDKRVMDALVTTTELAGQREQAVQLMNKLLAAKPDDVDLLRRLAGLHFRGKENDRAVELLRRAQKLRPNEAAITNDLARALVAAGQTDAAVKEARGLQAREPKSGAGFELEGDVYAHLQRWTEAESAYRKGLKVAPAASALAIKLHTVMAADGKTKEADAALATWMSAHPKDAATRVYRGDRAVVSKEYAAAAKHYEQAIALQPNHPTALNNLAWTLGQLGDPKAIEYAERAVRVAPQSADAHDTLGGLLVKRGDANRGFAALEEARRLAPQRNDLKLNYAKALIQAGRKDEARKELDALQATAANFRGKDQIPELLKSL